MYLFRTLRKQAFVVFTRYLRFFGVLAFSVYTASKNHHALT